MKIDILCDVKIWVIVGIILALVLGFDSPEASNILILVLIVQMAISLDGIRFAKTDFVANRKKILCSILSCFLINTGFTLIIGLFFFNDDHLWTGWVMLSSVPCAVSVVVGSLVMKGDIKAAVLSLAAIYACALLLTPLITFVLIGNSINPLEIFRYIVLFIALPFLLSFAVRKLNLKSAHKSILINVLMMAMVFVSLGSRKDFIFGDVPLVILLIMACVVRIFVVSLIMVYFLKYLGIRREDGIVYILMSVWKNSGMSISMTMALFATTMPDAVLPCVVSLVMEVVWFASMSKVIDKIWPQTGLNEVDIRIMHS